jgi:flavin reductase (DIM6/NTAB) family NADH-FMN oxidoreductase RutF
MRSIQDAMARRAGKLQPMIDKFVGVYWNPQTKSTTKTQGKLK